MIMRLTWHEHAGGSYTDLDSHIVQLGAVCIETGAKFLATTNIPISQVSSAQSGMVLKGNYFLQQKCPRPHKKHGGCKKQKYVCTAA